MRWRKDVGEPVRWHLRAEPRQLVVLKSPYRQFFERLLAWLRDLTASRPDGQIIVVIPKLARASGISSL